MNKPDYNNSITNLSNSILKHFNVNPFHNTIKEVDDFLVNKNKVIVFLFDGMGKALIEKHLDKSSFLRKHVIKDITSTFPPTTVAATSSMLSAKYPIETGWLSWTQYFNEVQTNVKMFANKDEITGEKIKGVHLGNTYCHYENIIDIINRVNKKEIAKLTQGTNVDTTHFWNRHLKAFIRHNFKLIKSIDNDKSFVYAYWTNPDHDIHEFGVNHKKVHKVINKINKYMEHFCNKNKDVTTIVIADHGLIDVKYLPYYQDKEIQECLIRPFSFEKRSANFFVKPEMKKQFVEIFNNHYGEHYELFTKEQIIDMKIYGDNLPSEYINQFFGDYIAIAKDEYMFELEDDFKFKAHHAGGTLDELLISVIGIN